MYHERVTDLLVGCVHVSESSLSIIITSAVMLSTVSCNQRNMWLTLVTLYCISSQPN